ncbi:membrane protein [Streptomyces inusitatus]|uniref:Membrane protein n=1 Tax=Streptomyces inusitatus TaxID=68221 RepID=A0A918QHS5_9ACTN|nr:endonuclease/exonuclease/phosphatase family protein [Streptomyces inusitatus]GGZ50634.1 membrane protein [Streptomyces inusitatus]
MHAQHDHDPPAAGPSVIQDEHPVPPTGADGPDAPPGTGRRRGVRTAVLAALYAAALIAHPLIPNGSHRSGSLVETFLPWSGLAIPPLLLLALFRRSKVALAAVTLPALAWLYLFGGSLVDKGEKGGELIVVSHNIGADNPDPAGAARRLADTGAQVIAVQELSPEARETFHEALPPRYRHHTVQGGVGLWSTYAMTGAEPVDIMPWPRALRATLSTPKGDVTVFVAHLASVRVTPMSGFTTDRRDAAARLLARAVDRERSERTLLVGDFNGTAADRGLAPVLRGMKAAQETAGDGFGFTWPARMPLARIDHILARGLRPVSARTLPATASDHLPVTASFAL